MRLWSLHPRYLDAKGLVALWREALLARAVLKGETAGYRNHPQLKRFKEAIDPLECIDSYLSAVFEEAVARGYSFDRSKLGSASLEKAIDLSEGQLAYEIAHLGRKLMIRDPERCAALDRLTRAEPHPLFRLVPGGIADWEIPR
jgi:hypothetical protein